MSRVWDKLPWCVLGSGRYSLSSEADGLWSSVDGTAVYSDTQGADWSSAVSTSMSELETSLAALTPAQRRSPETNAMTAVEVRLTCLLRHYNVLQLMLKCATTMLKHMMLVDSGCTSDDETKMRYGCLCRRRAKYMIVEALPEPTVKGKALSDIVADVITMNFEDNNGTSTELVTGGDDSSGYTTSPPTSNDTTTY